MLTVKDKGFLEVTLTNGTHVPRLTTLLAASPQTITLGAAEDGQSLAEGRYTPAEVKRLTEAVYDDEDGPQEVAGGWVFSQDVTVPQLDGHKCSEQLAQLLQQKVHLTLGT